LKRKKLNFLDILSLLFAAYCHHCCASRRSSGGSCKKRVCEKRFSSKDDPKKLKFEIFLIFGFSKGKSLRNRCVVCVYLLVVVVVVVGAKKRQRLNLFNRFKWPDKQFSIKYSLVVVVVVVGARKKKINILDE
jgi:hypothetical protein